MREIILDGTKIQTNVELHQHIKEAFSFPDYYGSNMDALYDMLCDISEETKIELIHYDKIQETDNPYVKKMIDVLEDAVDRNEALDFTIIKE